MRDRHFRFKIFVSGGLVALVVACATTERITMVPPTVIAGADYVGEETCALCHENMYQSFKSTEHGRIRISGSPDRVPGRGCEACHGAGSLHVEAGGGRGQFILNPAGKPELCFQCHLSTKVQFNLQYHHPVREKKMSCTNCHNPHGPNIYWGKGVYVSRENGVCMTCHREQTQPRVFEHEALREGCTVCHNPHGSINKQLLIQRDNNLCLKCHAQLSAPGTAIIGDFSHTTRLMQGTCWSAGCHTAVHGSNINAHLRY
jgi:predicted CXXCH cytochrome family protein